MGKAKVTLAIFDEDLKARTVGKYHISESGNQIKVKSGGEGHFMPHFDNDSFLEFPAFSLPFFPKRWHRVYMVRKGAKKCVNFRTQEVPAPDPELVKDAANKVMLDRLNRQKQDMNIWSVVTVVLLFLIFLIEIGVVGT